MYYRVIENNEVIDAISNPRYVYRNNKNGRVLSCKDEELAQGIISYDGSTIYQLKNKKSMSGGYGVVTIEEIDEATYLELRELFDALLEDKENTEENPDVNPEEPESPDDGTQETPETPEVETPMNLREMRTKIKELEEQLAATKILLGWSK